MLKQKALYRENVPGAGAVGHGDGACAPPGADDGAGHGGGCGVDCCAGCCCGGSCDCPLAAGVGQADGGAPGGLGCTVTLVAGGRTGTATVLETGFGRGLG